MLKRVLFACLLAMGAAHAGTDTRPVLIGWHDCTMPRTGDPKKIKLAIEITETGKVQNVRVVETSGDSHVDELAANCVSGWTYKPATHDGVPVAHKMTTEYHWGRVEDLEGNAKAFAKLERDADRRCHRLYPVNASFLPPGQAVSLVSVARLPSGEVQTTIAGSAGETADKHAVDCLLDLVKDHDDLPPVFARTIAVDWSHKR